jgi:superoxide dismutase, Fe-Mn family
MAHVLPELPFAKDAFGKFISAEGFEYHHGKHHAAYVNNLNKLIEGTNFESLSVEDSIKKAFAEKILQYLIMLLNIGTIHFSGIVSVLLVVENHLEN